MTKNNPGRSQWLVPVGLILLVTIPLTVGVVHLIGLIHAPVTPANARFLKAPVPVLMHVVAAAVYSLLGAFQFVPAIRRSRPGWHRIAGRVLIVPAGLTVAGSGLWMTLSYDLPATDGDRTGLLSLLRILVSTAMAACIVLGVRAAIRRDFTTHRAWMIRGFALGLGAGTQLFTHLTWLLVGGEINEGSRALLMGAGWVINLVVAEWIIRRRTGTAARRPTGSARPFEVLT